MIASALRHDIADPYRDMRHAMVVSQLRPNAVADPRVVAAMAEVPRERFVPTGARELAYRDTAVPVGGQRALNLPIATGRLLTAALVQPDDRVLLIGAATGYTAAVLARLAGTVVAVETDGGLADAARTNLSGVAKVRIVDALPAGDDDGGDFDLVVIDGAIEAVPDAIWRLVREGGRLVTGIVERGVTRLAAGRRSTGGAGVAVFADGDCVILPGYARTHGFTF